jgi:dephospho-CoA kinase
MIIIGLTGGILSGKSTVADMLAEKGAVIIDADKIGHEAYKPHTETWQRLVDTFGEWILRRNGEIDRKKLSDIVFSDPASLTLLNQIVHPRMRQMIEDEIEHIRAKDVNVVVLEAAVLIEAKWNDLVDEIWVTVAPEDIIIDRLQNRSGFTEEQARARIRSQLPTEEKVKHADAIIDTNCSLSDVSFRVLELWEQLQKKEKIERS